MKKGRHFKELEVSSLDILEKILNSSSVTKIQALTSELHEYHFYILRAIFVTLTSSYIMFPSV